jgi:hypothetical protein
MATSTTSTTTTPAATVTSVTASWLKLHERLICLSLVILFGCFGVSKFYDHEATVKQAAANAAAQIASADAANSKALATQAQQVAAQYAALVQILSTENASLNSAMAQRAIAQKTQISVDTNLPMTGVSARWSILLPTVTPSVSMTGGISLTDTQAHDTLAYMEQVPVLSSNLADETKIAQNYQQEVQKSDLLNVDLNSQILGLNKSLTDNQKACTLEIAAQKAQGKRNSIKWFKRGLILGAVAGLWAGHAGL